MTKSAEEDIESMMYAPMEPDGRSFENLYNMVVRDGIEGLMDTDSFSKFFIQFKELADREKRRFEESMREE